MLINFDTDGTIGFNLRDNGSGTKEYPQLCLSISGKHQSDIIYFQDIFGANIYYDKCSHGSYKWSISSKSDVLSFREYLFNNLCSSYKKQRLLLLDEYYHLKDIQSYKK